MEISELKALKEWYGDEFISSRRTKASKLFKVFIKYYNWSLSAARSGEDRRTIKRMVMRPWDDK